MHHAGIVPLALAAVVFAGAPLAGPGRAGAEQSAGPTVIRLVSITTSTRTTDRPPKGPSAGDTSVETSRLLNLVPQFGKRAGVVVGSDRATLTVTGPGSVRAVGVARLPGGTLTIRGAVMRGPNNAIVVAVVAGTGVFTGARGTVTIRGRGKRAENVYRLTYSGVLVAQGVPARQVGDARLI